jgi:hypothetical protein
MKVRAGPAKKQGSPGADQEYPARIVKESISVSVEIAVTLAILLAELGLLAFFFVQSRKPPDPNRVRVFPYTFATIAMTLLIFLTAAHLISLLTGTQVQPRRPKGMR